MTVEIDYLAAGKLIPAKFQATTLRELAMVEPEGVYTITRTYHGDQAVLLEAHFDRLEESARLEGIAITIDRDQLRAGLRQLIERAGYLNSRLRITIPKQNPERPILAAEPMQPVPKDLKERGVAVATIELARSNPRAKSNAWEQQRAQAAKHLPPGVYEGLLVDEAGYILEGFSSNFYGIIGSTLRTADEGILHGISRNILLDILPDSLGLEMQPIPLDQIARLEEAFISSSSRGLVPVVMIDNHQINGGRPGPLTKDLRIKYDEWVNGHLEPI